MTEQNQPGPYDTRPIPEQQPQDDPEVDAQPDEGEPAPNPYDENTVTEDMEDNVEDDGSES
jgi:hypothetical protein